MKSPSNSLSRLLARAAELRLTGHGWEAIAENLRRKPTTCKRWPTQYPELWTRALREAERKVIDEAARESLMCLRSQLRDEDAKLVRDAARALLKLQLDRARIETVTTSPDPLVAYIESLSHEERARLIDDLIAAQESTAPAAPVASETDPGGDRPE